MTSLTFCQPTNNLTPCSRVLPQKLKVTQLVKKFPAIYGTPKVHYRVHESPLPLVPNLGQMNPDHSFTSYFPKIHSNNIFPPKPSGFPTKILLHFSPVPCVQRAHPILLDFYHPNNIWWSLQVMKFLIMQSSPASYHFLPLRSKYSPQHPVLKHSQSRFFI